MQTVTKHTDTITQDMLTTLLYTEAPLTISLYMPTVRAGDQIQQNPIRFKNLVTELDNLLSEHDDISKAERETLIERLNELSAPAERFWEYQSDGLAIFISGAMFETHRLPIEFEELVVVGDHFHITPLIPLLAAEAEFYVLVLDQDQVRFLHGARDYIEAIELPDMPTSYAEALRFNVDQQTLQQRSSSSGGDAAIFHGQGEGNVRKEKIFEFLQQIDQYVYDYLDDERAPLVLAGVEYQCAMYRDLSKYQHIHATHIEGSTKMLTNEELHLAAWEILSESFAKRLLELQERWAQFDGTADDRAVDGAKALLRAAYAGRVETMLHPAGARVLGTFDAETGDISTGEQSAEYDLINLAAIHTLRNGGALVSVPAEDDPKAILRY